MTFPHPPFSSGTVVRKAILNFSNFLSLKEFLGIRSNPTGLEITRVLGDGVGAVC
jgi:hypothetical protein